MNLDARTLLFSLILINALMVLSLCVASASGKDKRQDGISKWTFGLLLETITWTLIAARGVIPDFFSVIVANGLLAGTYALMLAAIAELQQRSLPRWQYFVPIVLTVLMAVVFIGNAPARFVWGGLVYGLQMVLIARALLSH